MARTMQIGDKIGRIYGAPIGYGFTPEQSAIKFVDAHEAVFEPGMSSLNFSGSQDLMEGKFTAVYFQQTAMGLPVDKGHLTILVKNEVGSPIVLASSSVKTVELIPTLRQISAKRALSVVRKADRSLRPEDSPHLVVFDGETASVFAWSFIVGNNSLTDPKRFTVFVDASTSEILEWRDMVYYTDIAGHVDGQATPGWFPNQPNNQAVLTDLVGLRVNVVGGNSTFTGVGGNFLIPHPGTIAVDVQARLQGRWVNVVNQAGGNEVLTRNVTPPGPTGFTFNVLKTEQVQAQVDAFIHTEAVHNFAKAINASYPGIDFALPANVNLNNNCNAFYNGSSINFYTSGGGCPNTAYSGVVYHEYGHHIIAKGHPSPSGDYHEGIADVTASMLQDSPCLGHDFRGQGTGCLRNSYNGVMHPCGGGSHLCGQVISGAFWLTKDQLDLTIGAGPALDLMRDLYLNSILLHPPDINPGVTIDVLTLDDDDGDLGNGTPHYTEIATGFGAKGLDAPPLEWLTIAPLDVPGEFERIPTLSNLRSMSFSISDNVGTLDASTARLVYRENGGAWQERVMLSLSPGADFRTFLEVPSCGTIVDWYVKAQDTAGHEVRWPEAGPMTTMWALELVTLFEDGFDTNTGWTIVDDAGVATGTWERGNPNGSFQGGLPANPENDSGDPGTFCAFTGQAPVGAGVGTNDVDGGWTRLTSPVFDLSQGNGMIDFQQWFYNDDGDDSMVIEISNNNGASWTTVRWVTYQGTENSWHKGSIAVGNIITPTATMRVRFLVADNPNNSITEAAIDAFRVRLLRCN